MKILSNNKPACLQELQTRSTNQQETAKGTPKSSGAAQSRLVPRTPHPRHPHADSTRTRVTVRPRAPQ